MFCKAGPQKDVKMIFLLTSGGWMARYHIERPSALHDAINYFTFNYFLTNEHFLSI